MKTRLLILALFVLASSAHAQHAAHRAAKTDTVHYVDNSYDATLGAIHDSSWPMAYDSLGAYRYRTYSVDDTLPTRSIKYRVISRQNLAGDWVKNDTLRISEK